MYNIPQSPASSNGSTRRGHMKKNNKQLVLYLDKKGPSQKFLFKQFIRGLSCSPLTQFVSTIMTTHYEHRIRKRGRKSKTGIQHSTDHSNGTATFKFLEYSLNFIYPNGCPNNLIFQIYKIMKIYVTINSYRTIKQNATNEVHLQYKPIFWINQTV